MLTPKEKARELVDKFYEWYPNQDAYFIAQQCAIISVKEILAFMEHDDIQSDTCYWANNPILDYYYKVIQEIEIYEV